MTAGPSPVRGVVLIATAATVWSSGGLIVRLVEAGDLEIVFWRTAFAGLFLGLVVASRGPRAFGTSFMQSGRHGALACLLYAATFTLYILSLRRTTVAHTQLIVGAAPVVAALLAWPVLGERVHKRTWITIAVVFAGIGVMFADSLDGGGLSGDLLAAILAVVLGTIVVMLRRAGAVDLIPTVALSGFVAAVLVWPFADPFSISLVDMALLAVMGIFQLGLGLLLFVRAVRHLPATEVQLLALLETVLAPVWVWIAVGEQPTALGLVGGAVIVTALGVYFATGPARNATLERNPPIA